MTRKKPHFKHQPLCEVCRNQPAISFSLINDKWRFTCECTADYEGYWFYLEDFFDSPKRTVDWLAHVHTKPWMNWQDFMDMIYRFRRQAFGWEKMT